MVWVNDGLFDEQCLPDFNIGGRCLLSPLLSTYEPLRHVLVDDSSRVAL